MTGSNGVTIFVFNGQLEVFSVVFVQTVQSCQRSHFHVTFIKTHEQYVNRRSLDTILYAYLDAERLKRIVA